MTPSVLFIIAVTTSRMIFPGIPAIMQTPGSTETLDAAPAVKSLTMQLYSTNTAAKPEASVSLPAGLKLSETARMQVTPFSPTASRAEGTGKITVKTYWGSSDTVQTGQLSVKEIESVEQPSSQPDYKTAALWPGRGRDFEVGPIPEEASAAGTYKLTTNYIGGTSVTLSSANDFLAPIQLIDLGRDIDLGKPIKLQWNGVPNAVAYLVIAYGGNENETIIWAAGSQAGVDLDIDNTVFTHDDVGKLIEQKALLPADATSATIPAEIFKGSTGVMLSVTAVGTDKVQEKDGIKTQVLVRSTASVPLYSSKSGKREPKVGSKLPILQPPPPPK